MNKACVVDDDDKPRQILALRITGYRMVEHTLITFLAALFSMMNPIGNVGIFAGLTRNKSEAEAKHTA
jgi:hypothetical protein